MQSSTLLVLLLLIAVTAGAAWWFLGPPASPLEAEEDDAPIPLPEPRERPGPLTQRPSVVVQPPTEPLRPRIAVLAEGEELPEEGEHADAGDALHDAPLEGDLRTLKGADLLRAVAQVVYVRFRKEADLRALEKLDPDAEWPPDMDVRLAEVVEHWRRSGFDVEPRGLVLLVTRPEE